MRIVKVHQKPDGVLSIIAEDSRVVFFDASPYLEYEAFEELRDHEKFMKVIGNASAAKILVHYNLNIDFYMG